LIGGLGPDKRSWSVVHPRAVNGEWAAIHPLIQNGTLSQRQAASRLGVSKTTIHRKRSGKISFWQQRFDHRDGVL
jgi:Psq-like protein